MRVSHTDGTEADVYYGLEGGTGDVLSIWIKKPSWMNKKVSEWR